MEKTPDKCDTVHYVALEQRGHRTLQPKTSSWAARRDGTLNRFYTRNAIGDILTAELGEIAPHRVIDLGAGEGSLSSAVARKWAAVEITTVDIDESSVEQLHDQLLAAGVRAHSHCTLDVFDYDLPSRLGHQQFDLAVCNPPFFRPEWQPRFAHILGAAQFADACPSVADTSAEVLFFAQNLRLVREGGTIAIIVPSGLATGWPALAFRRTLLREHTLRTAIQLPPYSFLHTEAHCFILIVTKGGGDCENPVKLLRLEEGGPSEPIWVAASDAETRLDWGYHSSTRSLPEGFFTLRQLGAEVRRGSLSTVQRRAAAFPVFHTGDFPAPGESVTLPEEDAPDSGKVVRAEVGDILMARVDRDLHEKIAIVERGNAAITDCLFRIRLPLGERERAFRALSSAEGRARIKAATKGVGARLIGKGELLDLPLCP